MELKVLDYILVPAGLLLMVTYHLWLLCRIVKQPNKTVIGINSINRRFWVQAMMEDAPKNGVLPVQTLRNNIMASTLLASTAITLCSLIALLMTSGTKYRTTLFVFGDRTELAFSIKFFAILVCFLVAFLFNVQSIRYYSHASMLINAPFKRMLLPPHQKQKYLTTEYVATTVNRGSYFWSLGLRAFYFSFPLFLWIFGPIPMFLSCIVLVIMLYFLDVTFQFNWVVAVAGDEDPILIKGDEEQGLFNAPGMTRDGTSSEKGRRIITEVKKMQLKVLDYILVPAGLLLMAAYHLWLLCRIVKQPNKTVIGINSINRRFWVQAMMDDAPKNGILPVQTLRNNIMASTVLASTAIMLCSLIALLMTSSNRGAFFVFGNRSEFAFSIKFFAILVCFLVAFLFNVQSIRYYSHASMLINAPFKKMMSPPHHKQQYLTQEYVATTVNRGSYFWSLGLRAFYFSFPLFLWIFGPISMFLSCIVLVIMLYFLDFTFQSNSVVGVAGDDDPILIKDDEEQGLSNAPGMTHCDGISSAVCEKPHHSA
ncbi:hypothetical protein ACFX2J_042042 [Malus domestica]